MSVTTIAPEETAADIRKQATRRLARAVGTGRSLSPRALSDRLFARLFEGLVYPQIWEDPAVDRYALAIEPGQTIVTIASGGCNALSYLLDDPARIEAVDLNPAHVAFNRLKIAALQSLPDHAAFFAFFGQAGDKANLSVYRDLLRDRLDDATRSYWDEKDLFGRERIAVFARGLYRHGLLGRFIGAAHLVARLHGVNPRYLLEARTLAEQREFFRTRLAPLFERPLIRWATARKTSLFGLGIPPRQYEALARDGATMADVLRKRLEKLVCDFPLEENYFAWQAFSRRYGGPDAAALPPYLQRANFETLRQRACRLDISNASFTERLAGRPDGSVDRFVLLDAQDWMSDAQLNELWREITRTAAPGARVIFRTAADERLLPGRVEGRLLERWTYRQVESKALHARDRSAIYGGFHLYVLKDEG